MTDRELSYKAEAEYWKDQYIKLLARVSDVRELQKKRNKMKNWFPGVDKTTLSYLERRLDKKIDESKEDIKTFKQSTLFTIG
jgi:hypothetical protein